jgi:hypothetical protein
MFRNQPLVGSNRRAPPGRGRGTWVQARGGRGGRGAARSHLTFVRGGTRGATRGAGPVQPPQSIEKSDSDKTDSSSGQNPLLSGPSPLVRHFSDYLETQQSSAEVLDVTRFYANRDEVQQEYWREQKIQVSLKEIAQDILRIEDLPNAAFKELDEDRRLQMVDRRIGKRVGEWATEYKANRLAADHSIQFLRDQSSREEEARRPNQ